MCSARKSLQELIYKQKLNSPVNQFYFPKGLSGDSVARKDVEHLLPGTGRNCKMMCHLYNPVTSFVFMLFTHILVEKRKLNQII